MTTLHQDTAVAIADRSDLAAKFIQWLETHEQPAGLFTDDVFVDLSLPTWRLQTRGVEEIQQLRVGSHPVTGRVSRHRVDPTPTGFVLEFEERWHDGQEWYCRELMRAEVRDGAISDIAVYCTGDWDEARIAEHSTAVALLRP
jgi:hypothetical protein